MKVDTGRRNDIITILYFFLKTENMGDSINPCSTDTVDNKTPVAAVPKDLRSIEPEAPSLIEEILLGKKTIGEGEGGLSIEEAMGAMRRLFEEAKGFQEALNAKSARVAEVEGKLAVCQNERELEKKRQCTCTCEHIAVRNLTPNYKTAALLFEEAKTAALKQQEEQIERQEQIENFIGKIADKNVRASGMIGPSGDMPKSMQDIIMDVVKEIVKDLMSIKDPTEHDFMQYFQNVPDIYKRYGFKNFSAENPEQFQELCRIMKVRKRYKIYLPKMVYDINDIRALKLFDIWRPKLPDSTDHEDIEARKKSMARSADLANHYCGTFLKPYTLHQDVEAISDLEELEELIYKTLPTTADDFHLLRSAMAKVNMMHLAEAISSQIDRGHLAVATQHHRKVIGLYKNFFGKAFVPEEKSNLAIARKYMNKVAERTADYDILDIRDLCREGCLLSEEESKPENIEQATIRKLAYLLALFGSNVIRSRLRYAFFIGGTNVNSTGGHEAFHLTINIRYQCESNDRDEAGCIKVETIATEIQIRKYKNEEEEDADHRVYNQNKDRKITRYMGMDLSYTDFIEDICDAITDQESFGDKHLVTDKAYERPIIEKMALTLFVILTKEARENGGLANESVIKQISEDPRKLKKIRAVIDKFKRCEASQFNYLRQMREENGAYSINGRSNGINGSNWKKLYQKKLDATADSGEESGFVESSINSMALRAEIELDRIIQRNEEMNNPGGKLKKHKGLSIITSGGQNKKD
jgi:hypothetical protein